MIIDSRPGGPVYSGFVLRSSLRIKSISEQFIRLTSIVQKSEVGY